MQMMHAASCGQIKNIRSWWDKLVQIGPDYGYFPNPAKTCLLVKHATRKAASDIFSGTGISISCEGKKYLGAPLGIDTFVHSFIHQQISTWEKELKLLSKFAITQPHAAYAAWIHKQMYLLNQSCSQHH